MMGSGTARADNGAQWREERDALRQRVAELEAQLHQANASVGRQLRFTKALLAAIPTPVFFKDAQGYYIGCNDAFTEQMGVSAEEIKGKTTHDLWPSAYAEAYHQKDMELMQHPERQVYESRVYDKTGQDRHVILTKGVFYDESDQVAGLVGAYVDITERKRAEAALRESQALFQSLVESMPQNVFSKDLQGRFTFANRQYCKTIGRSLDDILGKTDVDLHPPPLAHKYRQDDRQVMQQRRVFQTIEEHQVLEGEMRYVQVVKAPLFDAAGQVSGVLGIFWDVTESVRMQEALRQSEENLATTLHAIGDGVIATDENGRVVNMNPVAEKLCGWTLADAQGRPLAEVFQIVNAETRATAQDPVRQVFESGKVIGLANHTLLLARDGAEYQIADSAAPIRNRAGEVTGVVLVFRDVTQEYATALRLRESEARLDLAMAVKNEGIWDWNLVTNETYFDDRYYTMAGYTPNAFPQNFNAWAEHVHPEDLPGAQEAIEAHLTGKSNVFDIEFRFKHKDNSWIWIQGRGKIVERDADGSPLRMIGTHADITTRKQAEEALQVSLEKYRVLFESFPLGITISDKAGDILETNRASERLLGLSIQEHGRRRIDGPEWQIVQPNGLPMPAQEYASVRALAENRLVENVEMGIVKPGDDIVWINVTAAPIPLEDYGVAVTYGDITERVQAQQALRQERDLSRALADAAALISRTLDPDEVLDQLLEQVSRVVPNDATNIMLIEQGGAQVRIARWRGYERFGAEEFISTAVFDLDAVPNLQQMIEADKAMIISDTRVYPGWVSAPEQAWVRSYAGAPIRVRGVVVGLLNVDSATPDFFTSQHADILCAFAGHAAVALENARLYRATQQELVERKRTERALRASEERYRRLFERSNDAIFVVDRRTGRYRDANAAAEKLTGRSCAELQGLTTLDVTPEGAQERLMQAAMVQQTLEMGEVYYLQPDGVTRTASLHMVPLNEQTVFGIARDITGRKEMEERLQRQERLAAIGQLAAGIAHDFRNLLTTVILYARLGQRHPDLPPAVSQRLDVIVGEAHKATDLVRQILDFGRRTEIDRRPLDLVALVGDVVTVLARTLPENIHITFDNEPSEACIVEGDAGRLQQVLTNLALNARDAMPGGGDLYIGVTRMAVKPGAAPPLPEMEQAGALPAWICLSVVDTGMGMSEEVRAHLFEPFFTTKEAGQGTGLGLAQVYGIVQLHAGYIDVETAVGQGAAFRIYLPAAAWVTEEAAKDATIVPPGQGETLLLVEDNAYLREAGQSLLTDLGYRVLTAANGREALALDQAKGPIALLITDLVMPEMGGKALLQALHSRAPDLKALAMTGYMAEESVETLRAAGFLEVIRKPFDADRLARAVRRALDEG